MILEQLENEPSKERCPRCEEIEFEWNAARTHGACDWCNYVINNELEKGNDREDDNSMLPLYAS